MPPKAKPQPSSRRQEPTTTQASTNTQELTASRKSLSLISYPLALLTLAAISSPISQATLAPVFGAIPSAVNHAEAVIATSLLAFFLRSQFKSVPKGSIAQCLAAWAFWIPVIQFYVFKYSGALGPKAGPGVIGFLSCHTIIIPAVYSAAEALEALDFKHRFGPYLGAIVPTALGVFHLVSFERWFHHALPRLTLLSNIVTPVKLQLLIASSLAYLAPSRLTLFALPALIHTFLANPHFDSANTLNILNVTLHTHDWAIFDRRWSNTGYISILESVDQQYRVMRCDHSLLGGEWLLTDQRRDNEGWTVDEPIYSVFEMLEAVRLIEVEPVVPDSKAQALVVGLGIGTTPKAFLAHGINTTIVEVDPIVYDYAMKYFGLPSNHTAIIQDAVSWVNETATPGKSRYDYIVHDVFTGGVEPLALFTDAFMINLRSLLKPNGVIAVNYAGDLNAPLTTVVLNTIVVAFDGQCNIYRDTPSSADEHFTNIIVFCRNTLGPIRFRRPTKADFLGSKSREHYMLPNPTFEISVPVQNEAARLEEATLKQGDEGKWAGQQAETAIQHWLVMRKVMPDAVWELW